jgi:hypothetical protein
MLKKGEGSHTLQRTPHATLPCAMTGQDRVTPSTPAYTYGEAVENKKKRRTKGEVLREIKILRGVCFEN